MLRTIKNLSRNKIETTYNHKPIVIKPKGSIQVDDEKSGEHLANYLLETYHFLVDVTQEVKHPMGMVKKAKGVKSK